LTPVFGSATIAIVSNGERQRFEVILESIESKIGASADGHAALNEKFDRLEGKVDVLSDDMALVKVRVGHIETRVGKIETRVAKIEHHLGNGVSNGRARKPAARKPTRRKPK
jgi:hypothetical protein